jgi:hypothetical protein
VFSLEKRAQALLTGDSAKLFSTEAYGHSELGITAARDLIPTQATPELDMLLVELHQVECEEDLINLSFSTTSIAEFQGRWFLGLWAGHLINVRRIPTLQVEADA